MAMKVRLGIPTGLGGQLSRYRGGEDGVGLLHHAELELEHVLRGAALCQVGDRRIALAARDLLWVLPHQPHAILEQSEDFEMWIACFTPRLVRQVCTSPATRRLRARRGAAPLDPRRLGGAAARQLCELLAEVSAYAEPATYNAGLGHLLLHAWLQYESEASAEPAPREPRSR